MLRRSLAIVLAFGLVGLLPAAAQESAGDFRVRSIEVQGTHRHAPEDVLRALGIEEGQVLQNRSFEREIERLWEALHVGATIHAREAPAAPGEVDLLVQVIEMPVDLEPRFVGNVEVSTEELLEWAGLPVGGELYLHEASLVKRRIEEGYRREGHYFAEVGFAIGGRDGGGEDLIFDVHEGPLVKVRRMVLHGNESVTDRGFWFWRTGLKKLAGVKLRGPSAVLRIKPDFVMEELEADLVAMRQVYRDRGWMDAVVELERLEFNAERDRVTLHVAIDEGPRYRVSGISLEAFDVHADPEAPGGFDLREVNPLVPREDLLAACSLAPGMPLEQAQIGRDRSALLDAYSKEGHVSDPSLAPGDRWQWLPPELLYDVQEHTVHVTYRIAEGKPLYIREILFGGNLHTRDRVLRRELSVFPGELADIQEVKRSLARISSTGFFEDAANVLTHEPPRFRFLDTPDPSWKDLEITVEEGKVLEFQLQGGVGDTNGAFINTSISMSNFDATSLPSSFGDAMHEIGAKEAFHGDGQMFKIFASPGTDVTQFGFNWAHPDIFARHLERISFEIEGSRRVRRFQDYDERRDLAGFTFGRQLDLHTWVSTGFKFQEVEVDDLDTGGLPPLGQPLAVPQLLKAQEGVSYLPHLSLSWVRRELDSRYNPHEGQRLRASVDLFDSAFGSDYDFARALLSGELFGLFGDPEAGGTRHGWRLHGQLGVSVPYGDTEFVPYTERFFAGGNNTLRGFSFRGVGPNENGEPIGGETMLLGSAEYRIPIHTITRPGTYEELEAIRLGFFTDAVILDPDSFSLDTSEVRASAGVLIGIVEPFPFYFSFGFPLAKGDGDDTRFFNFELGF